MVDQRILISFFLAYW